MKERNQQSLQSSVFQSLDIKGPNMNQNIFMQQLNPNVQTTQQQQQQTNLPGLGNQQTVPSYMNNQNLHNKKKFISEQRPLNLAEMMKSQSVYKQGPPNKKNSDNLNGMRGGLDATNQPSSDFIRGTQVMKDFQLIAEPIMPKMQGSQQNQQQQNIFSGGSLNSQQNLIKQQPKLGGAGNGAQHQSLSHPHTAASQVNIENKDINTGNSSSVFNNVSQMSSASSKQVLDNYHSNNSKQIQDYNNLPDQNNNIYAQNRSVAAKAGQMQIFNTDITSRALKQQQQLNQENQISVANKARGKFVSPQNSFTNKQGNGQYSQGVNGTGQQNNQLQQQEPAVEFKPVRIRNASLVNNNGAAATGVVNNNTNSGSNPKYIDYVNRFQPNDGTKGKATLGNHPKLPLQAAYDANSNLFDNLDAPYDNSKIEGWGQTSPDNAKQTGAMGGAGGATVGSKQYLVSKSRKNQQQILSSLNISGEQMHIEEKNNKKGLNTTGGGGGYDSNQRQNIKLQNNNTNNQNSSTLYDYLLVQINQNTFENEFADKMKINNDILNNNFKLKRQGLNPSINTNLPETNELQQLELKQIGSKSSTNQFGRTTESYFSPQNAKEEVISVAGETLKPGFQLYQTSLENMKVIAQSCEGGAAADQDDEIYQNSLNSYISQITQRLSNCGKSYKISSKKRYLRDLFNARGGGGQNTTSKIAQYFIIIINNSISSAAAQAARTIQDSLNGIYSSSGSLSEDGKVENNNNNNTNNQADHTDYQDQQQPKKNNQYAKESQNTTKTSLPINKSKNMRNNSTIQPKGYESENEVRSMNSTTTSSTMPFLPTRNQDGANTNKSSARSLSQKGGNYQPRRLQQKQMSMDETQLGANLALSKEQREQSLLNKDQQQQFQKYGPTKIKIVQNAADYNHLEQHKINKALSNYNTMIQLCFRTKGKLNLVQIANTAKSMGIVINRNLFADQVFKSREHANMLKEKIIGYLCKVVQEESLPEGFPTSEEGGSTGKEMIQLQAQPQQLYKCFVGKGNNSILIRTLFKTRFWWLLHDKEEIERVNFMWTQIRKNTIIETFSCKYEEVKSGLKQTQQQTNSLLMTPKTSASKLNKKKRKNQLQQSSQSLESSTDKKDTATTSTLQTNSKLGGGSTTVSTIGTGAAAVQTTVASNEQQQAAQLAVKLYNKLEDNFHLSNKKALFLNMKNYYDAMGKDVFSAVPVTFHIKEGFEDAEFIRFKSYYQKEDEELKKSKSDKQATTTTTTAAGGGGAIVAGGVADSSQVAAPAKKNIWIIKPGENTNRGQGIQVAKDYEEIKKIIDESTTNKKRTCIVQKYIHNPLLINKRKFDIRAYAFFTSINGSLKGYWYADGYLRTSCREFTLNNLSNRMIHLTNDAVQKYAEDYGKYEPGNKLSYNEFQNYLDKHFADLSICFERDLLPQMKKLATDTFRAVYGKIDPKRRVNTFEIYGLDFMFDDEFKTYLIEVNTNPCLELGCPLLARLIPNMVENALRITVDPLFPPPENFSQKKCIVNDICPDNKYELIFDEKIDGPYLNELMKEKNNIIIEIDEEELSDCDEGDEGDN